MEGLPIPTKESIPAWEAEAGHEQAARTRGRKWSGARPLLNGEILVKSSGPKSLPDQTADLTSIRFSGAGKRPKVKECPEDTKPSSFSRSAQPRSNFKSSTHLFRASADIWFLSNRGLSDIWEKFLPRKTNQNKCPREQLKWNRDYTARTKTNKSKSITARKR